ncbi:MAG TPA: FtsX-like permease family protein [bacterium]|nr:FtsX-like permease family protein [bacterium]HPN31100.1 FtsX-like permease family protein [bacterium]
MKQLIKIAWRNILKHKGKSIVIGTILFLGSFLMTVGNGVISGMDKGLQKNIVDKYTGHIVLISSEQQEDNVIFSQMGKPVEIIEGFDGIKKILDANNLIDKYLPVGKEFVMLFNEDGEPGYTLIMGVDFVEYQKMFGDNIVAEEGNLLKKNERGVLITTKQREEFYDYYNYWCVPENSQAVEKNLSEDAKLNVKNLNIKRDIVFMGFSEKNSALDIRTKIKGIVKFSSLNSIWGHINFCDIESFRECFGWVTSNDINAELSKGQQTLLNIDESNLEALFGGNMETIEDNTPHKNLPEDPSKTDSVKPNSFKNQADTGVRDSGAYNIVFIKLKKPEDIDKTIKELSVKINELKLKCRVISWKKAVGQIADIAAIIRAALFGFVMLLFFVAIIIIMNTLSMTALERVSEIGMMRAVGASKGFISGMFVFETAILSFIFGGSGIIAGIITTEIIAFQNITTSNDFLQLLYGGDSFMPLLGAGDVAAGIIQLVIVTILSMIYPVLIARKITPLDAISRE